MQREREREGAERQACETCAALVAAKFPNTVCNIKYTTNADVFNTGSKVILHPDLLHNGQRVQLLPQAKVCCAFYLEGLAGPSYTPRAVTVHATMVPERILVPIGTGKSGMLLKHDKAINRWTSVFPEWKLNVLHHQGINLDKKKPANNKNKKTTKKRRIGRDHVMQGNESSESSMEEDLGFSGDEYRLPSSSPSSSSDSDVAEMSDDDVTLAVRATVVAMEKKRKNKSETKKPKNKTKTKKKTKTKASDEEIAVAVGVAVEKKSDAKTPDATETKKPEIKTKACAECMKFVDPGFVFDPVDDFNTKKQVVALDSNLFGISGGLICCSFKSRTKAKQKGFMVVGPSSSVSSSSVSSSSRSSSSSSSSFGLVRVFVPEPSHPLHDACRSVFTSESFPPPWALDVMRYTATNPKMLSLFGTMTRRERNSLCLASTPADLIQLEHWNLAKRTIEPTVTMYLARLRECRTANAEERIPVPSVNLMLALSAQNHAEFRTRIHTGWMDRELASKLVVCLQSSGDCEAKCFANFTTEQIVDALCFGLSHCSEVRFLVECRARIQEDGERVQEVKLDGMRTENTVSLAVQLLKARLQSGVPLPACPTPSRMAPWLEAYVRKSEVEDNTKTLRLLQSSKEALAVSQRSAAENRALASDLDARVTSAQRDRMSAESARNDARRELGEVRRQLSSVQQQLEQQVKASKLTIRKLITDAKGFEVADEKEQGVLIGDAPGFWSDVLTAYKHIMATVGGVFTPYLIGRDVNVNNMYPLTTKVMKFALAQTILNNYSVLEPEARARECQRAKKTNQAFNEGEAVICYLCCDETAVSLFHFCACGSYQCKACAFKTDKPYQCPSCNYSLYQCTTERCTSKEVYYDTHTIWCRGCRKVLLDVNVP